VSPGDDPAAIARAIIDANLYMVLSSADAEGQPWATPVYFAPAGRREFLWVSRRGARHSRNLRERSELGIVAFDSSVPINSGQAVYMSAVGGEIVGDEREEPLEVYTRRALAHGGGSFTLADV
jgi:Pyridoxamine 5'-phosphate oxidase